MNNIDSYNIAKCEYINGATLKEIENKYGIERHWLSNKLRKDGVEIRKAQKKYNHNEEAFSKIDNEEAAYWLGFLYADGHVICESKHNGVCLTIQYRDIEHLCKFRDFISPSSPVKTIDRVLHGRLFQYCRLDVFSSKISKDLVTLGCVSRKSAILTFPSNKQVPQKWLHHFIRGYFDGDGCVTTMYDNNLINVSFIGTKKFLTGLIKILKDQSLTFGSVKITSENNTDKVYRLSKGGAVVVKSIFDYLYNNASVYLTRKKSKFVNYYAGRASDGSKLTAEKIGNPEMGIRPEGLEYCI